jgi:electron transfer flavoprotein alpha subunit
MATIISPYTRPQTATVRPNVFTAAQADLTRPVNIEEVPVSLTKANIRTRLIVEILLDSDEERIEEAKIIALNKDLNAPIFKIAELGIVGDALVILPKLIDEIRRIIVKSN